MLKVWGRANSSNVVKVMWCLGELGLAHERIDWAGRFGGNDDPKYRKINPTGRVPTIEEDDGFTLWESGAIVRYLCALHSAGTLYPTDLRTRAEAEKWMDWSSLYLQSFNAVFNAHLFVLPPDQRDPTAVTAVVKNTAPLFDILDHQLADRAYLCGDQLTMADIPAGSLTHRWMAYAPDRPSHPNVEAWYERLKERTSYRQHVMTVTPGR
jgi:glutathione S-transferase